MRVEVGQLLLSLGEHRPAAGLLPLCLRYYGHCDALPAVAPVVDALMLVLGRWVAGKRVGYGQRTVMKDEEHTAARAGAK